MQRRRLAKKEHSAALAQLTLRTSAIMMFGAGIGEEPFAKVKGLVTDFIKKLQAEASSVASEAEELKALADATKAARQERVLFRARPARFAHPAILMLVLD